MSDLKVFLFTVEAQLCNQSFDTQRPIYRLNEWSVAKTEQEAVRDVGDRLLPQGFLSFDISLHETLHWCSHEKPNEKAEQVESKPVRGTLEAFEAKHPDFFEVDMEPIAVWQDVNVRVNIAGLEGAGAALSINVEGLNIILTQEDIDAITRTLKLTCLQQLAGTDPRRTLNHMLKGCAELAKQPPSPLVELNDDEDLC